jgi:hypothetical protein
MRREYMMWSSDRGIEGLGTEQWEITLLHKVITILLSILGVCLLSACNIAFARQPVSCDEIAPE